MIRLVRVELTRLRCRRAALVLLIAAVVVPLIMAVVVAINHTPPQADAFERAQRQADKAVAQCVEKPKQFGVDPDGDVEQQCRDFNPVDSYSDYTVLDLVSERENGSGPGMVAVIGVLMFLLGTTFVGHDWNTGSMSNQLLFEPRRLRIWTAKAIAVLLGGLAASVVGATLFWLVLYARFTMGAAPLPDGVLLDCLQQGWRGTAVAGVAALGGYALTMLSRSTVFTLGLLFGVSVAGGIFITAVVDDPGWFDPTINASAVVKDGTTYYVDVPDSCFDRFGGVKSGEECSYERDRSLGQGVGYLAIVLGVVGTGSVLSFRRRDVP